MKEIKTLEEAKEIIGYQYQEMNRLSKVIQEMTEELSLLYRAQKARVIGRPPAPKAPATNKIIDLDQRRRARAGDPPF
jgi:DNA transposition AAA+ family ATPase